MSNIMVGSVHRFPMTQVVGRPENQRGNKFDGFLRLGMVSPSRPPAAPARAAPRHAASAPAVSLAAPWSSNSPRGCRSFPTQQLDMLRPLARAQDDAQRLGLARLAGPGSGPGSGVIFAILRRRPRPVSELRFSLKVCFPAFATHGSLWTDGTL